MYGDFLFDLFILYDNLAYTLVVICGL